MRIICLLAAFYLMVTRAYVVAGQPLLGIIWLAGAVLWTFTASLHIRRTEP